jgi:hypothetical protein
MFIPEKCLSQAQMGRIFIFEKNTHIQKKEKIGQVRKKINVK